MHVHAGRLPPSLSSLLPSLPFISLLVSLHPLSVFCFCSLVTLRPYFSPLHHLLTLSPFTLDFTPRSLQRLCRTQPRSISVSVSCVCVCMCVEKGEGSILLWKRTHFWTTIPLASPPSFLLFFVLLFFFLMPPHRYKRTAHAQAPSLPPNRVVL